MNKYLQIFVLLIVAGVIIYFVPRKVESPTNGSPVSVTDFDSCRKEGYPVLATQPAQCIGPDGAVYLQTNVETPEVVMDSPLMGEVVKSPLTVSGKARGNWFFEANIPATLKDENGKVLAQKGLQAEGDWMIPDHVNFSGSLEFETPTTDYGVLLIEKDNPSGLPENDAAFAIPVRFR